VHWIVGTLFTVFLYQLNKTCEGEGVTECDKDIDCVKGEKCGLAGYTDWCIANVKKLQSIVDYGTFSPASSIPGLTAASNYWSSTTNANNTNNAWNVNFNNGNVNNNNKYNNLFARAVRPCK
jgi:hypothetical protein